MENLELLTNKELRAKCLEYHLPNVPVTDSSRKILIRRLYATMNPNINKQVNRRKTVASSEMSVPGKQLPAKEVKQSIKNTRNTISATSGLSNTQTEVAHKPYSENMNNLKAQMNMEVDKQKLCQPVRNSSFNSYIAHDNKSNNQYLRNTPHQSPLLTRKHNMQDNFNQFTTQSNIINNYENSLNTTREFPRNNSSQRYTNNNDINKLQIPTKLTLTKPSVVSHKPQYTFNNHNDNHYEYEFQSQITPKRTPLHLPELVNDNRDEFVPKPSVDQNKVSPTLYSPISRTLYSRVYDEPSKKISSRFEPNYEIQKDKAQILNDNVISKPVSGKSYQETSSLYPRLDDFYDSSPRFQRSNSLSKSGVVTTSFTQEINGLPTVNEKQDIADENFEQDIGNYSRFTNVMHNQLYNSPQQIGITTQTPTINLNSTFHNRNTSPRSYKLQSYSEQYSNKENLSDEAISSDEDDQYGQNINSRNLQIYNRNVYPKQDMTLSDLIEEIDRKYYVKQVLLLIICVVFAIFIYNVFFHSKLDD